MPAISFDRYYRYDELTRLLDGFAEEYPHLVDVTTIGKSHEGRDIWLATVTCKATGSASDKPAFWCDGNIHASEVSASTAVLHILNSLCTQYGGDEAITQALDSRAFYLVPRFNPDGAEWALETPPRVVRSSTRNYPYEDEDLVGLERQDLDSDGRILTMRVPDPNGAWKVCEEEPRLLVRRPPGEIGGQYYRIFAEGLFHNFDGIKMRGRRIPQGLDMNRNFPSAWRPENDQFGAGPYPTSEPEVRSIVQAITERPNICGAVTFHTFSGVHLRPPSRYPDDEMLPEDLWVYKAFGKKGEELTGYPAISNFHEFKYHPKEVITGVFDDWMYEHRGVFAWTTEIWSPQRQAGITDYKYIDWFRDHPVEDDIKLLRWSDEHLDGKGHIDWFSFEHPQLGPVEIGGWDGHLAFRNPPPKFLEKEVRTFVNWVVWQALASPKLEHRATVLEPIQGGARVRVAVHNTGYLPTQVTQIAKKANLTRGVNAEISRSGESHDGKGTRPPTWLISGDLRQDAGQLTGWSHVAASGFGWQNQDSTDVAVFEWVLAHGNYEVVVKHERAGVVKEVFTV
ncbi:MAG TPA: M14 family metallopeptidase [Fimbriimonadaceae bacterium]|nr:M14 family metallopeptidase [Fimbriimonadaceae bacterium]